ncbi:MAG: Holliday junction resolvase RuvX [Wolbachia endosymbiont of Tyrophagus putrescentiae]|nr:Holliday junction resolvase RuvX [Wolbachia endosymbiont of Tyrophagus putrescentiae]
MLHRNLNEFCKSIPRNMRIMCLDVGEKRTGIAFSDKTQLIATAHSVYHRRNMNKDLGYFNRVLKDNAAGAIVIGLPLEMNEQESAWCGKVIHFANKMVKKSKVNVYLQDERLSTFMAIQALKDSKISFAKSKKIDDKVAACIILQWTLDKINTTFSKTIT